MRSIRRAFFIGTSIACLALAGCDEEQSKGSAAITPGGTSSAGATSATSSIGGTGGAGATSSMGGTSSAAATSSAGGTGHSSNTSPAGGAGSQVGGSSSVLTASSGPSSGGATLGASGGVTATITIVGSTGGALGTSVTSTGGVAGSGLGGSSASTSTSIALSELSRSLASAQCNYFLTCNGPDYGGFVIATTCNAEWEKLTHDQVTAVYETSIAAGRIVYDPAAMPACVADQNTAICDGSNEAAVYDACSKALKGTVPIGGDCFDNYDCDPTAAAYCKSAGTCPGKCAPREPAGGACIWSTDCQNFDCGSQSGVCGTAQTGSLCDNNTGCPGSEFCLIDTSSTADKRCAIRGTLQGQSVGAPCGYDSNCVMGLYCPVDYMSGKLTSSCQPTLASGAACHQNLPNPCADNEYCPVQVGADTGSGTCSPRGTAGQPCDAQFYNSCAEGFRCGADSRCHQLLRLGDTCSANNECYSLNCVGNVCQNRRRCEMIR